MRKIRILNIVPDIYTEGIAVSVKDRQALAAALKEETGGLVELESRIVEGGSESIECFYDSALAAPYILKLVQQGEKDGFDAIVLDCFLDPALSECRELVRIPVMGACQSSCSLAARMAGRFSVIGILDNADRCIRENIRCYCFERQLASIPVIHMPVVELHNSEEARGQGCGGCQPSGTAGWRPGGDFWLYLHEHGGGWREEKTAGTRDRYSGH